MKILTRTSADWRATLNVVTNEQGEFGWEVEVYDPAYQPADQTLFSPTRFSSSTNAAIDGLRALDDLAQSAPGVARKQHN